MTRDDIQIGRLYRSIYKFPIIYASYIYPVSKEINGLIGQDAVSCIAIWGDRENTIKTYTLFELNKYYELV